MEKILVNSLAMLAVLGLFGCGGKKSGDIKLTAYDTGTFHVGIPDGWSTRGGDDSTTLTVYKSKKKDAPIEDVIFTARMNIWYDADHGIGRNSSMKAFKESYKAKNDLDANELTKLTNYEWAGFTWTDNATGAEFDCLLGKESGQNGYCWKIEMTTCENGKRVISIADADVQAIINSLKPNK